jgi:hypothetical protein
MNLPTLKQAIRGLEFFDQSEVSLEKLQELYDSGLLTILLRANISKIDKAEFRRVCGLIVSPLIGDAFEMVIDNVLREFRLILFSGRDIYEMTKEIARLGFQSPEERCLDMFQMRYPESDGKYPVGLARIVPVGECSYPVLVEKKGKYFQKTYNNGYKETGNVRWLVERR